MASNTTEVTKIESLERSSLLITGTITIEKTRLARATESPRIFASEFIGACRSLGIAIGITPKIHFRVAVGSSQSLPSPLMAVPSRRPLERFLKFSNWFLVQPSAATIMLLDTEVRIAPILRESSTRQSGFPFNKQTRAFIS